MPAPAPEDSALWESAAPRTDLRTDSSGNGNGTAVEGQAALSLDEAVARIPAGVRRQLEELFHGRFIGVKRIPREKLR